MTRRLRLLGATLAAIVALVLLAVFGLAASHCTRSGRPAPALPSEHLAGPPTALPSLLAGAGGRSSLVIFWASWCEPCVREAPAIERFAASPAGRGRVVGVDWSDRALRRARFHPSLRLDLSEPARLRRHGRQQLRHDRAADDVRARRQGPHSHAPAWPAERAHADSGLERRRTGLSCPSAGAVSGVRQVLNTRVFLIDSCVDCG